MPTSSSIAETPQTKPACCETTTSCGSGKTVVLPPELAELAAQVSQPTPVDIQPEVDPANPWLARQLVGAWYTAWQVLFEELPTEPKRILHIGGCRQRDLARRLGFLLPFAKITVADADETIVAQAENDIRCRFTFTHTPLPELPFETGAFDLILLPDAATDTTSATAGRLLRECQRVAQGGHIMVGERRSVLANLIRLLPGGQAAFPLLEMPETASTVETLAQHLWDVAQPKLSVRPVPFTLSLHAFRPLPQRKTTPV